MFAGGFLATLQNDYENKLKEGNDENTKKKGSELKELYERLRSSMSDKVSEQIKNSQQTSFWYARKPNPLIPSLLSQKNTQIFPNNIYVYNTQDVC